MKTIALVEDSALAIHLWKLELENQCCLKVFDSFEDLLNYDQCLNLIILDYYLLKGRLDHQIFQRIIEKFCVPTFISTCLPEVITDSEETWEGLTGVIPKGLESISFIQDEIALLLAN